MKKLPFDFLSIYKKLSTSPYKSNPETLHLLTDTISNNILYGCIPGCSSCCFDKIIMSYSEFEEIMAFITSNWSTEQIINLFTNKVGNLNSDGWPICPFINVNQNGSNCLIYSVRPWICRTYGTTSHPCERIPSNIRVPLSRAVKDDIVSKLILKKSVRISNNRVLLLASFEMWLIADCSKKDFQQLFNLVDSKLFNPLFYIQEL